MDALICLASSTSGLLLDVSPYPRVATPAALRPQGPWSVQGQFALHRALQREENLHSAFVLAQLAGWEVGLGPAGLGLVGGQETNIRLKYCMGINRHLLVIARVNTKLLVVTRVG